MKPLLIDVANPSDRNVTKRMRQFFKWIITSKGNHKFEYNNKYSMVITITSTVVLIVIIVVFLKFGYIIKFHAVDELGNIFLESISLPLLCHKLP
jgi:hypothetical protein